MEFIYLLKAFNRKERFALINKIFGTNVETPHAAFINELKSTLNLSINNITFWGVDYHIDWLAAALAYYNQNKTPGDGHLFNQNDYFCFTQEDIDFIVCFKADNGRHNIILVEAKYCTKWKADQLDSKTARIERIVENNKKYFDFHMILMSPFKPQQLQGAWEWMPLDHVNKLYRVARCVETNGNLKIKLNNSTWAAVKDT